MKPVREARFADRLRAHAPISEHQLQRELDLPGARRSCADDASRGTVTAPRKHNLIRVREICVIEDVEGLRPELQIQLLVDFNSLE
jgi:hypothetical protein